MVESIFIGSQKVDEYEVVKVENKVINGDFSQGERGWETSYSGYIDNEVLVITTNGRRWNQEIDIPVGNIIYLRAKTYTIMHGGSSSAGRVMYGNISIQNETPEPLIQSALGATQNKNFRISVWNLGQDTEEHYDDIVIVDLTSEFGAGNEPSKEWCDEHLEGYFEGKRAIRV